MYRTIRERILSGDYGPGYRVVIDALAAELGVSALPVREAIRRLEAEGLVVFRPNAGAHVAPADPGVFDEEMTVARGARGVCDRARRAAARRGGRRPAERDHGRDGGGDRAARPARASGG